MTVHCNQVSFTDLEYDQLSYLLDMLRNDVCSGLKVVERLQPQSRITERLRMDQEMIISFIDRIESR